ncbi:acyl-CoA thioesterase/bile acid-CoA:amino acid N-acyltransferase family protein [Solibacillus sp. FSL R7-0682]|uniref:acyl-CoA thioesterase/bile acid-CoA:amino acid N-acyltransferase family protein n=2 Tax=unclassified Solibacillus TaxID=2637870 RepID=UPI0030F6F30C
MCSEINSPRIVVSAISSLIDRTIDIQVIDLQPQQEIEIRARRTTNSLKPLSLESNAKYRANNEGIVDLNTQQPLSGTYSGINGMGLFWSFEVVEVQENIKKDDRPSHPLSPHIITLSLLIDHVLVDEVEIKRLWLDEQISRYSVKEHGLVGTYFYNENITTPLPGIIILGGSEGGIYEYPAALLASHGFSVLALAYFGVESLPKNLVNIPLEYVKTAIDWMKQRNEVTNGWLGIHGTSRGAELSLLSASLFPELRAAVALNGFAVAFSGIVPWTDEKTLPPAWLYQDKPLPYLSPENPIAVALSCKDMWNERRGNPLGQWYSALASDPEATKKAEIQVEKINGPVLIISGEEDDVDTVGLSQRAIKRLEEHRSPYPYDHLIYPGAGHSIGIPNLMIAYKQGNTKDNAYASKDSWAKTIAFFKKSYYNYIMKEEIL